MKLLFNLDFNKKNENHEDVSDQYMLLDLLHEAIDKNIPKISLTNNKFNHRMTLTSSTKS